MFIIGEDIFQNAPRQRSCLSRKATVNGNCRYEHDTLMVFLLMEILGNLNIEINNDVHHAE